MFAIQYQTEFSKDIVMLYLWFSRSGWLTNGVNPHFQLRVLSEIPTIANFQHAVSWIWTCAETEFRICWIRLFSSDNHYTTAPYQIPPSYSTTLIDFFGFFVIWMKNLIIAFTIALIAFAHPVARLNQLSILF